MKFPYPVSPTTLWDWAKRLIDQLNKTPFDDYATQTQVATKSPAPTTAVGVGQWRELIVVGGASGSVTLPAGGTWAYLFSNNGGANAGASVAPGGTVVFSGNVFNVMTLGWRLS